MFMMFKEKVDYKFLVGIILVLVGQYMHVAPLTIYGSTFFTNAVQMTGIFLALWHAALTIYLTVRGKK